MHFVNCKLPTKPRSQAMWELIFLFSWPENQANYQQHLITPLGIYYHNLSCYNGWGLYGGLFLSSGVLNGTYIKSTLI